MLRGTMLRRKMHSALMDWAMSGSRKAFMLVGARQTGKTYVLREFARTSFVSFVEVNLLEGKTAAKVLSQASDVDGFLSRLSLISDVPVVPNETLIFLDDGLHSRLIELFRYYVAIGGMPEVVQTYLGSSYDMGAVRDAALQIVEQYRYDIAKYARGRAASEGCLRCRAESAGQGEQRFRMDALKDGASFGRYADDFAWLVDASVVNPPIRHLSRRTRLAGRFKAGGSSSTGRIQGCCCRNMRLRLPWM